MIILFLEKIKKRFPNLNTSIFSRFIKRYENLKARKNISLITQFFPPDYAATGQLLDDLTRRISSKYQVNFEIYTGMPSYAFKKGIKAKNFVLEKNRLIKRLYISKLFDKTLLGKTLNGVSYCLRVSLTILKRNAFNSELDLIVYSTEPPFLPFIAWLIYKLTKIPYILIVYDIYPDVLTNIGIINENSIFIKFWQLLNFKSFSKASEIIVLSKSMKIKLKKYIKNNENKISIIPSWADPEKIYKINKKNNQFAIDNKLIDTFNVLYSGNQGRCHDLSTIIDTAILLSKDRSIKFIFIGDGPQNSIIKKLVSDFSLTNCIFLPFQEKELLPLTLNIADLALITLNSFSEGLVAPSKLYGHLAASTPVAIISPNNSYLKELVEEYSFGRWFINGDSNSLSKFINELKLNKKFSYELGNNGRNYLLKYAHPEKITEKYFDLFNKSIVKGNN